MTEAILIRELNERIKEQSSFVVNLTEGMNKVIVGQKHLIDSLLIGLLSDGHILLEGVPGLIKKECTPFIAQNTDDIKQYMLSLRDLLMSLNQRSLITITPYEFLAQQSIYDCLSQQSISPLYKDAAYWSHSPLFR